MEIVCFRGHKNIRATHPTTFEITREDYLTPRGDCIIGVCASKGLKDFRREFKEIALSDDALVLIILVSELGNYDVIRAYGSSKLTYEDPTRIIVRKSNYTSPSTIAVRADKAAKDLNRDLINDFKKGLNGLAIFIAYKVQKLVTNP